MSRSKFRRRIGRCPSCGQRLLDGVWHLDVQRGVYACTGLPADVPEENDE